MRRDSKLMRGDGPTIFTSIKNDKGVDDIVELILGAWRTAGEPGIQGAVGDNEWGAIKEHLKELWYDGWGDGKTNAIKNCKRLHLYCIAVLSMTPLNFFRSARWALYTRVDFQVMLSDPPGTYHSNDVTRLWLHRAAVCPCHITKDHFTGLLQI